MTKFEYIEVPFTMSTDLIVQINIQGEQGWRFNSMAQKVSKVSDLRTGQPKVDIVLIFERSYEHIPKPEANA